MALQRESYPAAKRIAQVLDRLHEALEDLDMGEFGPGQSFGAMALLADLKTLLTNSGVI
jgi:hypothetical protein